jgi:hypothetical protein
MSEEDGLAARTEGRSAVEEALTALYASAEKDLNAIEFALSIHLEKAHIEGRPKRSKNGPKTADPMLTTIKIRDSPGGLKNLC